MRSGTNPYRHKDACYFLPSEDEWFKAAYHKNDGVTANYWDYPTQDNWPNPPDGIDGASADDPDYEAVFYDGSYPPAPYDVADAGSSSSAYGTYGQGGNVWEWHESAFDGLNDIANEPRGIRGGRWLNDSSGLRSVQRSTFFSPSDETYEIGFRVASVEVIPEPSAAALVLVGLAGLAIRRRRGRAAHSFSR